MTNVVNPRGGDAVSDFDIGEWIRECMVGKGGSMKDFEAREGVYDAGKPRRVAAANFIVRCLANPKCEGSDEALRAIIERRGGI